MSQEMHPKVLMLRWQRTHDECAFLGAVGLFHITYMLEIWANRGMLIELAERWYNE